MFKFKCIICSSICFPFLFLTFLSGCISATDLSEITINPPEIETTDKKNGRLVYINQVNDKRYFAHNSQDPSVAVYGFTKYEKEQVIGRKKSSGSIVLGGIILKDNKTINEIIKKSMEIALETSGYTVIKSVNNLKDVIVLNIDIEKMWTWNDIHMTTVDIGASIKAKTTVSCNKKHYSFTSEGNFLISKGIPKESYYSDAINNANKLFIKDSKNKLEVLDIF